MAELVRFHGDKIFGTFLEPDNLISKNNYPCTGGTKLTDVKLKKPDLPRYSYRYRAAEIYGQAADMTDDRNTLAIDLYIIFPAADKGQHSRAGSPEALLEAEQAARKHSLKPKLERAFSTI